MKEVIYEWEEFKNVLEYFEFDLDTILDFEEHYQNLNVPTKNFEDFISFKNLRDLK